MEAKKILELKGHAMAVYAVAQGREPHLVFTASADKFVAEWNLDTGMPEAFSVKVDTAAYSVKYIESKSLLLIGTSAGHLHVIDLHSKQEIRNLALHQKAIFDIAVNEENGQVISLSAEGLMAVWDSTDWSLVLQIPLGQFKLRQGRYNHDYSRFALVSGDGMLRIFETEFFNEIYTIKAHSDGANAVAWHPNGKQLITGGKDAYLRFWDVDNDYQKLKEIPAHNFAIYSIVFSPNGRFCASASRDKTIKIWDANAFDMPLRIDRKSHQAHVNSVNSLYWSPFNSILCSGSDDKALMLWQIS